MPFYRRARVPGGTWFFTLVTEGRAPILVEARSILHTAIADCATRHPFTLRAIALMPDHLHFMLTLPSDDDDFSTRIAFIKSTFTHHFLERGGHEQTRSESRIRKRRRGVRQRWFIEHLVRDQIDYNNHLNYIHYNPVKHGLVTCPHLWPHSTFRRYVRDGTYPLDWSCSCDGHAAELPRFGSLAVDRLE